MGVFTRPDSPWYWLWLETAPPGLQKEKTDIRIGVTVTQRHDSAKLADTHYHKRMNEIAARVHRLPVTLEATRFRTYAATYQTDVLPTHKGAERELDILKLLVAFFGQDLLTKIDQDRVREYWKARLATTIGTSKQTVRESTVNREVDVLKSMLRDAVPKYLDASPLVGMKRLKMKGGTGPKKKRLLQPAEEARLLAVATDPQDYALLVVGIDTLVRLGDLLDLQRTDRNGLWLTIQDPKGDEPYDVPLSPRAATALDAITHDQPYYFEKFRRAVKPRDWRGSVRQRLEKLCATATPKIPFGKLGITFHGATRKTGATRLLIDKRQPVPVVQALGNWKTPDVLLAIYTEAQRGDLLAAVGQSRRAKGPVSLPAHSRSKRKRA